MSPPGRGRPARVEEGGALVARRRGRGVCCRGLVLGACLALLALAPLATPARAPLRASPGQELGFSPKEISALDEGEVIIRVLAVEDAEEVDVLGVVRADVPRAFFLRAVKDVGRFQSDGASEIGVLGAPPAPGDFARLSIPERDIRGLRKCRPGDCVLKLPAGEMRAWRALFHRERDAAVRAIDDQARRWMLDLVRAFMARGGAALPVLNDQKEPVDPDAEFRRLVEGPPLPGGETPGLRRYVEEYPRGQLEGAESLFFWAREDYGLKPTLTLNQAVTYAPRGTGDATVLWRRLYASHYINGSLGETRFLARAEASYVVQVERARLDMLGGFLGRFYRGRIESGLAARVRKFLAATRGRLDADAGKLDGHSPTPFLPVHLKNSICPIVKHDVEASITPIRSRRDFSPYRGARSLGWSRLGIRF